MIAPIEISIIASKSKERAEKQEELRKDFEKYFTEKFFNNMEVKVWLELYELSTS
ncbi:MAG: hypothetical protein NTY12_03290 [Candidatus Falkowbacteria bacterium]|nr:hypothetical protein [Candidatus Falkowbacteria bacterium]